MKKAIAFSVLILAYIGLFSQQYKNFKVSVYCMVYDINMMADTAGYLKPQWQKLSNELKIDKVYIETYRDNTLINEDTLKKVLTCFENLGVEIAGGVTLTSALKEQFETFCYHNAHDRQRVKTIMELTARNFDEIILDDFFFTSCKTPGAIEDKGARSWTDYRLDLMREASETLIIEPVKSINPHAKVIIKYPNWYPHFAGLGFDLETQAVLFDGIFTGTETRSSITHEQHLQAYHGYDIYRYFENIAPGKNGGGWVDPFKCETYDRYAEQLQITAFAGAKEICLFYYQSLLGPIDSNNKAPWNHSENSFDYEAMLELPGKPNEQAKLLARTAGYALEEVDNNISSLGRPIGVKSYRPFHSRGEDFLTAYLGNIGIAIESTPHFPESDSLILLTEAAKYDTTILYKIKTQLIAGKHVILTSGFVMAMQDKGLHDLVELGYTHRKATVSEYLINRNQIDSAQNKIMIPQLEYLTNDSWEMVSGIAESTGYPILHKADYGNGRLYILTIPDNFSDLYQLPQNALNVIREVFYLKSNIKPECAANVAFYLYDNNRLIIQSFLNEATTITITSRKGIAEIKCLSSSLEIKPQKVTLQSEWTKYKRKEVYQSHVRIPPHSYLVLDLN